MKENIGTCNIVEKIGTNGGSCIKKRFRDEIKFLSEFAGLRKFSENNIGFGVPEIIEVVENDDPYIIMSFINGRNLNDINSEELNALLPNLIRYMKIIHGQDKIEGDLSPLTDMIKKYYKEVRVDKNNEILVYKDIIGEGNWEKIQNIIEKYENTSVNYSVVHGDLLLNNVMYKDDKIFLIDFEHSKIWPSCWDIGLFLFDGVWRNLLKNNLEEIKKFENSFLSYYLFGMNEQEREKALTGIGYVLLAATIRDISPTFCREIYKVYGNKEKIRKKYEIMLESVIDCLEGTYTPGLLSEKLYKNSQQQYDQEFPEIKALLCIK